MLDPGRQRRLSPTPAGEPDGYPDLVCQFADQDGIWSRGEWIATLTGNLKDGTPSETTDSTKITQ
jgi:hypothetical protein